MCLTILAVQSSCCLYSRGPDCHGCGGGPLLAETLVYRILQVNIAVASDGYDPISI